MQGKDFLSVSDMSSDEIYALINSAIGFKSMGYQHQLKEKTLALLFEKASLRTRVSFELSIRQLGGSAIYLSPAEIGLGKREAIGDIAQVLNRYVDVIAARTFSHRTLDILSSYSRIPVINALSDREHPCQALADILTIFEKKGSLKGLTMAYIGDGNNVAHSLMLAASITGINFRIASPSNYQVSSDILNRARGYSLDNGSDILCTEDALQSATGVDVIYTDVWTSMGQENESEKRRQDFSDYRVDERIFALAKDDAIFMHPLPAHRGEEVTAEVIDSPRSVVFDQAENRLHMQKALLMMLLSGDNIISNRE
ncbi:MAG: ornithine carbamoyltransferase [Dehalococcoidales bacterium]